VNIINITVRTVLLYVLEQKNAKFVLVVEIRINVILIISHLFDLIRDKIYDELDNDEIFNLALQMGIDCSKYVKEIK